MDLTEGQSGVHSCVRCALVSVRLTETRNVRRQRREILACSPLLPFLHSPHLTALFNTSASKHRIRVIPVLLRGREGALDLASLGLENKYLTSTCLVYGARCRQSSMTLQDKMCTGAGTSLCSSKSGKCEDGNCEILTYLAWYVIA